MTTFRQVVLDLFLLASFQSANAQLRAEALFGTCAYSAIGDGVWYQDAYPHALDMRSNCGLVGVSSISRKMGKVDVGWRISYVDFGAARSDAIFAMVDAEQKSKHDGSNCNPATMSGCLGRGVGMQTAEGLSFGAIAEHRVGDVTLGAEAGLFVYDGGWQVRITSPHGKFSTIDFNWSGYQVSPYLGGTLRYGYLMAMARAYGQIRANEHGCGGCSGIAQGLGTQVLAGVSIPF